MPRKPDVAKRRLKEIRPFVNFNYDLRKPLTASQKRKIKKYHDEIKALTARPFQVFRPRSARHLLQAQEFAQHEKHLPGLKVAFIPTDGSNKVQLSFTKKGVIGHTQHVASKFVRLSVSKLLSDPEGHVASRIAPYPQSTQFTIRAGKYEIPQSYARYSIPNAVARLTAKYNNEGDNHYFGHWLHGLTAHTFKNQAGEKEYRAQRDLKFANIQKGKKARRRAYRQGRYAGEIGNPITDNPYTGDLADAWIRGWRRGSR